MRKLTIISITIFSAITLCSCTSKSVPNWDSKTTKVNTKNLYTVKKGVVSLQLDGVGTLVPIRETNLYFNEVSGVLQKLNVKVNDTITDGQVVGEISSDNLNNEMQQENNSLSALNVQLGINQLEIANLNKNIDMDNIDLDFETKLLNMSKKTLDTNQITLQNDNNPQNQDSYDKSLLDYQREQSQNQKLVIIKQQHQNALAVQQKQGSIIDYNVQNSKLKIQSLQKSLDNCKLVSHVNGKVTYVENISLLDYISSGRIIAKVVEPKNYALQFSSTDLKGLSYGDKVKIKVNDIEYDGSVYEPISGDLIKPQDPDTSVKTNSYLVLDKLLTNVKYGDKVPVSLITQQKTDAIIIPRTAIKTSNSKTTVNKYINGKVETVEIKKGMESGSNIEVISGINAGDSIMINY